MEYVSLPGIPCKASRLGFGGCPLGGHGWGQTEESRLRASIHAALSNGVTFFDTADIYGLGTSERILGEELKTQRDNVVLATKFGVRRDGSKTFHDNSASWMRQAIEASLTRLGTDRIDLFQLHYWDKKTSFDEIQDTAESLIREGKALAFGVTNMDPRKFKSGANATPVSFSNELNLVRNGTRSETLDTTQATGATFIGWGCLAQGALTGKYKANHKFSGDDRRSRDAYVAFHGLGLAKREAALEKMSDLLAHLPGKTHAHLALRWILDSVPSSITLAGVKSPDQILGLLGSQDWHLSPEQIDSLTIEAADTSVTAA